MSRLRTGMKVGTKNLLRWFYKKQPKLFLRLLLITIVFFYLLGVLFPIKPIKPYLIDKGISLNDLINRFFQLLAAFAAFVSAFIALFRDELRRKFLEVHNVNVDFVDSINKLSEAEYSQVGETDEKKVSKYICELEFKNLGNVHEKGCEIYIQNIILKNTITDKPIKRSHKLLNWDDNLETKILIPVKGKAYLTAFSIFPPEEIKESDSMGNEKSNKLKKLPPKINIADYIELKSNEIINSVVTIEYLVCFDHNQPKIFDLIIKWNGDLGSRITDMNDNISITLDFDKDV